MRIVQVPTAFPKYVLMRLQQFICQYKCFEKRPPKNLKFLAVSGTKFKFKIFHEKLETHIMNAEQRFLLVLQDKTCKKYKICHLCGFFTACNLLGGKSSARPLYKPQTPPLKLFIFSLVGSLVCNRLWNKSGAIKLNVMTASDKICTYILRM